MSENRHVLRQRSMSLIHDRRVRNRHLVTGTNCCPEFRDESILILALCVYLSVSAIIFKPHSVPEEGPKTPNS